MMMLYFAATAQLAASFAPPAAQDGTVTEPSTAPTEEHTAAATCASARGYDLQGRLLKVDMTMTGRRRFEMTELL